MARLRPSCSVSMMFREHPILDRFAAARSAGFLGVEIQVLEEGDPAAMAAAARDAGVEVVLINVGMGDLRTGGPGLSGVPGREAEFREALRQTLDASRVLGANRIHLGPSRIPPGTTLEECLAVYRANLAWAVAQAAGHPASLLIEPLNRVESPTILLGDLAEAGQLIQECRSDRVGLQFDIYHAAMNGVEVSQAFHDHLPSIRHVQFADAPGRHEPGTGQIDFAAIFATIAASPYAGWAGAEYLPATSTASSFAWRDTLNEYFSA